MTRRVNVGCGRSPTPGWINYDNSPSVRLARSRLLTSAMRLIGMIDAAGADFARFCRTIGVAYADAASRIPEASGAVDVVYSSHMIEHLDRKEARRFLAECQRVLRPGGVLRLVLPDVSVGIDQYLLHRNADSFVAQLLFDIDKPRGIKEWVRRALTGGRGHHWMYDGRSISRLVTSCGFTRVEILGPGETRIADPGELDLSERGLASLCLETIRP